MQHFDGFSEDQFAVDPLCGLEAHLPGCRIQFVQALEGTSLPVGEPVVAEIAEGHGFGSRFDGRHIGRGFDRAVEQGVRLAGGDRRLPQVLAVAVFELADHFDGGIVGLDGYTLKVTGGADKNGFTMKKDVPGTRRIKSLLSGGIGYHPKSDGVKRRKTVRGNTIADDIVQVNTVVVSAGSKAIADILGVGDEEEEE